MNIDNIRWVIPRFVSDSAKKFVGESASESVREHVSTFISLRIRSSPMVQIQDKMKMHYESR
jgi:hypothetical protein